MSEHIIWESDKTEITDYLGVKHSVSHLEKREEIVRCRDCKCFDDETSLCYRIGKFPEWHACTEPDGFCAWGERG